MFRESVRIAKIGRIVKKPWRGSTRNIEVQVEVEVGGDDCYLPIGRFPVVVLMDGLFSAKLDFLKFG